MSENYIVHLIILEIEVYILSVVTCRFLTLISARSATGVNASKACEPEQTLARLPLQLSSMISTWADSIINKEAC